MSTTITSTSTQLAFVRDTLSDIASHRLLDNVDINLMSAYVPLCCERRRLEVNNFLLCYYRISLGDLIVHRVTPKKLNNPAQIRTSSATFLLETSLTPESVHSTDQKFHGVQVRSPNLISPASTAAAHPFTTPAAYPTIITQRSAPNPRRGGYPRRRSTYRHPLSHSQLQPRVIIHEKALRLTSKRPDRRRSRTYWPVWYQKQRRREYKEAVRNMKLDEQRRLELMELWEDEFFQILMYLLTEHLKRAVLALALELRMEMERLDEIELELLNEREDLG